MSTRKVLSVGSATTLLGGAAGTLALAISASPASAVGTTFTVDTLADGAPNAADCITPVPGSCSLRDALDAVSDGDSIVVASGLTGTITLTTGTELYIADSITLTGPGASLLTIDATGNGSRVFYMCGETEISGVTITGGSASRGGGLYQECGDPVTLRNVVVTGNSANTGGAFKGSDLILIDSEISNNTAAYQGGGVDVDKLTMSGSTIRDNSANGAGGGVYAASDISISTSTIAGNAAGGCGGGLYSSVSSGTVVIQDSLFEGNSSTQCYGGAIDIDGNYNDVTIANTTIVGNSARTGGGVHVDHSNTLHLFMSTVSGNAALSNDAYYSGGGIHVSEAYPGIAVTMDIVGSIVSGNTAVAGPADIGFANYSALGPASLMANSSILGDLDAKFVVVGADNITTTSPGLAALANNGGATRTMALLPTSPAIDAGPATVPTFPLNANDQRGAGFARVVGTRADIGAFEVQAPPTPPTTAPGPVVPAFTG